MEDNKAQSIYVSSRALERYSVEHKIKSFTRLPTGWYYGEGVPASSNTVETVLELVKYAKGRMFFEFEAFPGANGEIMLSIYWGNFILDLGVEPDISITATFIKNGKIVYDHYELTVNEAMNRIIQFRKDSTTWMPSDFSTQTSTVTSMEGLQAMLSKTLEITRGFLLSTAAVYATKERPFVVTSESITKTRLGNLRFAGGSTRIFSQVK
jgi:hypothetical protein